MSEPNDDDLKALLAKRQHAKPNKATWVLLVLLLLAVGFALGSCMQKAANGVNGDATQPQFPGSPPSGAAGAGQIDVITEPSQPPIASDPTGAIGGRPAGALGDLAIGTVTAVDGGTLTIATADGQTITIDVPEGTSVTSTVAVPLAEIPVGSDVIVRGTQGEDGTFTADSVSEGSGGFPGGGLRPAPAP